MTCHEVIHLDILNNEASMRKIKILVHVATNHLLNIDQLQQEVTHQIQINQKVLQDHNDAFLVETTLMARIDCKRLSSVTE
jgi:predicted transcriptional regulator